jgi:hypothetical protein
MKATFKGC